MKSIGVRLGERHQPSGLNSRFKGAGQSFTEYLCSTKEMLRQAHGKLGTLDLDRVLAGNSPFELPAGKPCRRGVLLTHGLTDSPYLMRALAEFFSASGFHVMALLLPGNGTQPGDLLDIAWQEWAKAVAYCADRLAEEVDEIYLSGYSLGGTLSLYQSLQDQRVRGLFLFAPALKISPRAAWAKLHKLYSWMAPSAKWLDIKPDLDIYKYESFPKNAAAQVYALTRQLEARLSSTALNIPLFAAASLEDSTVYTPATLQLVARAKHPSSRLVLYAAQKFQPEFASCQPVLAQLREAGKLERVNSLHPEQRILGSAHTALVLPGTDPHYGTAGEYCNCAHYYPHDMEKYAACLSHPELAWQGEISAQNKAAGLLRRLSYNPDFAALENSLRQFMDTL